MDDFPPEPPLTPTSPNKPSLSRFLVAAMPFLLAVPVMLSFLTIPRQPYHLDDSLAEKAVLNYAHEHRLQFGTDVVFSYGPLGFLTSRHFFPDAAGLRMLADVLVCFSVAAGVCLAAWRLRGFWRWLLVGLFIVLASNIDPRADLLLYVGSLCWGLLCMVETGWRLAIGVVAFSSFAAFGGLVKANFLFVGGLSVAAVGVDLILRGHYRGALGMVTSVLGLFVLGWIGAGQELSNLTTFLRNSISIVQGYDQAVGFEGLASLLRRGLWVLALALGAVIIRVTRAWEPEISKVRPSPCGGHNASPAGTGFRASARKGVVLIWLCALLLLIWKHGFVRADLYHMGFFFGFAPILALALELLSSSIPRAKLFSRGFALACCLTTIATLDSFYFLGLTTSLLQPFHAMVQNAGALINPGAYQQEMLKQFEAVRRETQLPRVRTIVGQSTVDVFGQQQFYALFNELNYHPRPVFQSYMAYNRTLIRLNEAFYLSPSAPEFVLFELNPIDRKFPPVEDALVLLHLLINYEPAEGEGPFLLLQARARNAPELTLLREGTVKLGERISLVDYGDADLWMEVEPVPTWLGRAKEAAYKASKLRVVIWGTDSKTRLCRYGTPAPMLRAGFLASPLLLNNDQVRGFYNGQRSIRPASYSVEVDPGQERYWQEQVRYRLYKVVNLSRAGGERRME